MRVLVTGGSGFIGNKLLAHLRILGHDTFNLDSRGPEAIDLLDQSAVAHAVSSFRPELVYHLAAFNNNPQSFKNPHLCLDLNFRGTLNILEALRGGDCRGLIIPSTYYLKSQSEGNFDSPYIYSKHLQEGLAQHYRATFGTPVCIVRLANVYGHNPANETLLQSVSRRMLANEPLIETGDLDLTRDFIFVEDVTEALSAFTQANPVPAGLFELGSGESVKLHKLVEEIKSLLSYPGEIKAGAKSVQGSGVKSLVTDPDPLKEALKWKPKFTIKSGLSKMLEQMKTGVNSHE